MATAQSRPLRCTEECPLGATVWRSPPDPTDKLTADKGQVAARAQALEQASRSSTRGWPPAK